MGLFDRLFGNRQQNIDYQIGDSILNNDARNEKANRLLEYGRFLCTLNSEDRYIAKSDYLNQISDYKDDVEFFDVLKQSGMLKSFCKKNGVQVKDVDSIIKMDADLEKVIDNHNEKYIAKAMVEEKQYLDDILKTVDPNIILDDDQRRVVLTDEDYCLVIAGSRRGRW
jgi:DNA helicase-4